MSIRSTPRGKYQVVRDCNKGRVREGEKDEEYGNEEYMNRSSRKHKVEEVSILIIIIIIIIIIIREGEGEALTFCMGRECVYISVSLEAAEDNV